MLRGEDGNARRLLGMFRALRATGRRRQRDGRNLMNKIKVLNEEYQRLWIRSEDNPVVRALLQNRKFTIEYRIKTAQKELNR